MLEISWHERPEIQTQAQTATVVISCVFCSLVFLMTLTTGLNERFFASFVIQFYCTYNMVQRRFLMLNDALYIILDIFYTSLGGSSLNFQNQRKARSVKL